MWLCTRACVCKCVGAGTGQLLLGQLPPMTLVRNREVERMWANLLRQNILAHYLCLLLILGGKRPLLICINCSSQIFQLSLCNVGKRRDGGKPHRDSISREFLNKLCKLTRVLLTHCKNNFHF